MSGAERGAGASAPRRRPWRWIVAAAVVLVVATAAVFLIALRYARPLTEGWLSTALGAPVTIGTLSIDLLGATVSAGDVVVGAGAQSIRLTQIGLTAQLRSLWRSEVVIDQATLSGLTAAVEIDADHHVHIEGLPVPGPQTADAATAPTQRVTIQRLLVHDLRFVVHHALQGNARAVSVQVDDGEAQNVGVAIDGSGLHLGATLRANAEGVPLTVTVGVQPAGIAHRIDVRVEVSEMALPTPLFDLPPPASGVSGTFSGTLVYRSNPPDEEWVGLDGDLRSMQLVGAAEARVGATSVGLEQLRVNLATTSVDLGHLTVTEPVLVVALTPDGVVLPIDVAAPSASGGTQWEITGGRADVSGGEVSVLRHGVPYVLAIDAAHWEDITSSAASTLRLDAHPQDGGTVAVAGTVVLDPMSADLVVTVAKLGLPTRWLDPSPQLASLRGAIDGTVAYRWSVQPKENVLRVDVQAHDAQLTGRTGTAAAARTVKVEGMRVDLAATRVDLGTMTVAAPTVTVALTPDGLVLPLEMAGGGSGVPLAEWSINGGHVNLTDGSVTVLRDTKRYTFDIESAVLDGDVSAGGASIQLKGGPADGGTVHVSGKLGLGSTSNALAVDAADIKLAGLAALMPELPVEIARGTAGGVVTIDGTLAAPRIAGKLQVDDVATAPPNSSRPDEVLAAHQIEAVATIDVGAWSAHIESLTLHYPYVMIARSAAGVFPYTLFDGAGGAPGASPVRRPAIRITKLDVEGGRADFLDRTVTPPYWTALAAVTATLNRVVFDDQSSVADFRIAALQDEINPVQVHGVADDTGWHAQVDVRAVFLPSLNVYLAPLLGYEATTGMLSLGIDGHISTDLLSTLNEVTLRNVAMTQTGLDIIQQNTGVPLPIALALLKDVSGTIKLAVPIEGDPATRNFRLGSLVTQALSRAVQGALTSPLRLLGLLFGTKGPPRALAVDPIPFSPGSGALDVVATARIEQIARILATHTDLTLVAKPELSAEDVALVGRAGLEELATERSDAVANALVEIEPRLSGKRLVMVPWKPEPDGTLSERSDVYVEMQLSADYGG